MSANGWPAALANAQCGAWFWEYTDAMCTGNVRKARLAEEQLRAFGLMVNLEIDEDPRVEPKK
jgi:hypothetical protein